MDYRPLIEGISKIIGATGKIAEKAAAKGETAHTSADVERWLGSLSDPKRQVPIVHDYLRGEGALSEAQQTGATHVRDISVPIWESTQKRLQTEVDADPEVQRAIRDIYIGKNTPRAKGVVSVEQPAPVAVPNEVTAEVPSTTPLTPQAKPLKLRAKMTTEQTKQQADAWNEFAVAVEAQDAPRIDEALERIRSIHPELEPGNPQGTVTQTPEWQRALDYMASLEQQVQQMRALNVQGEDWSKMLDQFRESQGANDLSLPRHVRSTVDRFEAWADAQKPPSAVDRVGEALGVPRAIMASADLSAPGRQGLLMISRPEYWQNLKPMIEAWSPAKFQESQKYLLSHPDFAAAQEAGLALTNLHSKLAPREEAFQSRLAERIPILGNLVKSSEQAYTTFLNRLRMDVFSNSMKQAAAAGLDVTDKKFMSDLAEWINTSTGRGGKGFNPGVLSTVLFSPRLAASRFQTFNPQYYYKLHPRVRQEAIKANLAAAGLVFSLVSLAKMNGAQVSWDFRNPDAGKIRIGNTRLDLGGGHLQFLRLFTQIASNQKVNSETGKVTELGNKFGDPSRLDVLTQFLISKEAPVPSLVTDWLRGKDLGGNKFNLSNEAISRIVPLAVQDVYDVVKDKGIEGLFYAAPATLGVGVQTYAPRPPKETIPFLGVLGEVPPEKAAEFTKVMEQADSIATTKALIKTKNMSKAAAKAVTVAYVKAERLKARKAWIMANRDAFVKARQEGVERIPLTAPVEE